MGPVLARYSLAFGLLVTPLTTFADLTMGIFPRKAANVTVAAFTPLADKLSAELGEKVTIVPSKDFASFWQGVKEKKFDIVHYNQYHYVKSNKDLGYKVFAVNVEEGQTQIAGAIAVRKDSGITKIADLKGKTVLFGGNEQAMGSYIAPMAILKKHGLGPSDIQVKFSPKPPDVVMAVYNKAADAAGMGDILLELPAVKSAINVNDIVVLEKSESFAQLPWAVKDSVSADKVEKITKAMTSLKSSDAGKAILKAASVDEFVKATDADFKKVREIIEFATGEKL